MMDMNKEQFHDLTNMTEVDRLITAYDLKDRTDRTLLYGYTCERDTWHVYIQRNHIFKVIYNYKDEPEQYYVTDNYQYVPDKRLYPECCDYEFCKLLKEREVNLPFTTWQDRTEKKDYWGETL
jgi:hypothetical protein